MMISLGVSPLRGFPVERRGIGHLVPILGGQRLAGLVRLGGGVCPSAELYIYTAIAALSPKSVLTNVSSKFDEFLPSAYNSTAIIA